MKTPPILNHDKPKLVYLNHETFYVLWWNETHVDEYQWDGFSKDYQTIRSYRRHDVGKGLE